MRKTSVSGKLHLLLLVISLSSLLVTSCRPPAPSYSGYGYLIVAPEATLPFLGNLVDYKASEGFLVEQASLEEILASSPGADDAERVRNLLLDYSGTTQEREFVLLVGSMDTMPMRIAYPDPGNHGSSGKVPTDFYYEELTGDWDADGDGFYGEYGDDMSKETEDYLTELYVGRIPWDDANQVQAICDTIIQYEQETSARLQRAIAAAAVISLPCDAALWVQTAKTRVLDRAGYQTTTLYDLCPVLGPDFPLTRENFLAQWEQQEPGLVAWFSHGNSYGSYYSAPPGTFIDVDHIPQGTAPAVGITSGCTVGAPDVESLGRVLVREGVCPAFLGSSRVTYFGDDPIPAFQAQFEITNSFLWERRALSEARRISTELFVEMERVPENLEGRFFHQNLFQFMIFGDPSIQLAY